MTVHAKYSKHRRKDVMKLREDIAAMMRAYCQGLPDDHRIWPGNWWKNAAEMLRLDLEAAGIPYEVGDKFFDFHGTRKTFISWLEQSGARIKVAQGLARHSTITLTMDTYAFQDHDAEMQALNNLPPPAMPKPTEAGSAIGPDQPGGPPSGPSAVAENGCTPGCTDG